MAIIKPMADLRELPPIRRARGFHLYSTTNIRFIDLYREKGAALMGYRKGSSALSFKNTLSRLDFCSYGLGEGLQLKKAIMLLLPQVKQVAFFHSVDQLQLLSTQKSFSFKQMTTSLFYSEENRLIENNDKYSFYLLPPLLGEGFSPQIVVSFHHKQKGFSLEQLEKSILSRHTFSSAVLCALTRRIYDLIDFLPKARAVDFSWVPQSLFKREGWELYWKGSKEDYENYFLKSLKFNLLFNPDYQAPSLLPFSWSEGEQSLLIKRLNTLD